MNIQYLIGQNRLVYMNSTCKAEAEQNFKLGSEALFHILLRLKHDCASFISYFSFICFVYSSFERV